MHNPSSQKTTVTFNRQYILEASQGILQKARCNEKGKTTIFPGEIFTSLQYPNKPRDYSIPKGCIGIVHEDIEDRISVVRDDCQAARRWLNKHGQKLPTK